jgi:hypothetical protein
LANGSFSLRLGISAAGDDGDIASLPATLRREIELMRRDLTIRLGGTMVVGAGVLLAAIRYLPLHP